ncbi:MAG: twin-arginine translocase subunit TatC [Jatrophihabitans sp.]|uniref:twin-arginine translocase subunit TatC n=1 Tax=Jatrophihabitans sp. TaxID=1932789 RepID=UPI003F7EC192
MASVAGSTRRARRRRPKNPDGRMPVMDHLRELRRRILTILVLVAAGAVLGWFLYPQTLELLRHPYCNVPAKFRYTPSGEGCVLIYHGVLDGFTTRLKVSVISGAVFTGPLWLYQIWAFITPGLRRNERKYTIVFIIASTVLFAAGMALAYTVLAKGLRFVLEQAGNGTQAQLTVSDYISFVTLMLVVFGAAFEVPLIVVMANFAGALPARLLKRSQRIGIFLIFLFAAVATPSTDPFTMCAMAIPMVLLFEAAVVIAIVHDRRKARRKAAEREQAKLDDTVASEIDAIPQPLEPPTSAWADTT